MAPPITPKEDEKRKQLHSHLSPREQQFISFIGLFPWAASPLISFNPFLFSFSKRKDWVEWMAGRKEIKQLKNSIIDSFVFILRQISSIIEVLSLFDSFNYCYNIFLINSSAAHTAPSINNEIVELLLLSSLLLSSIKNKRFIFSLECLGCLLARPLAPSIEFMNEFKLRDVDYVWGAAQQPSKHSISFTLFFNY